MKATITISTIILSIKISNIISKIELLKTAKLDFTWSYRITIKYIVTKLKPARINQVIVRKRIARYIRIIFLVAFSGILYS